MAHGHDILHMMEGNNYQNKEELVNAIIEKFGPNERFHTCSVDGFTAKEMVDFLEARGKFKPLPTDVSSLSSYFANHTRQHHFQPPIKRGNAHG